MNIIVLNGSPKGELSVTMQYIRFLQTRIPGHTFTILPVAHTIGRLEKDPEAFAEVIGRIEAADGVLWAFPLYILHVHAAYKRFIELVAEREAIPAFRGKYAAALSTSIKFFDHTAHEYIHGICDDWQMGYCGYFSAHMTDLFDAGNQRQLLAFADNFLTVMESGEALPRVHPPIDTSAAIAYASGPVKRITPLSGKRAVIVTDAVEPGANLSEMIVHLRASLDPAPDLINLSELNIKGGCLGCLHCGFDNECVYDGRDDVRPTYEKLREYDIIVFAGAIRDRYLSARWKQFYDRRFFGTHQPQFIGKQFAFLISGPLGQIPNLRHILHSFVQFDGSNVVDFLTDEAPDAARIDALIEDGAARMVRLSRMDYIAPMSAPAVTGRMVFRDHIWGGLRFVFQGDHRYYRKNKWYDFPQKDWRTRLQNLIMIPLTKVPPVKAGIQKEMRNHMIRGYQRLFRD